MKKPQIILLTISSIIISGGIFFGLTKKGKGIARKILGLKMKRAEADKILGGTPASYGDNYVIAWATAKESNKPSFTFENKEYFTTTGKIIK